MELTAQLIIVQIFQKVSHLNALLPINDKFIPTENGEINF